MAVIDRIIKASSNPGDLVMDPFLGSGTTADVAIRNGRKVVGFELKANYCRIAVQRIKAAEAFLAQNGVAINPTSQIGDDEEVDAVKSSLSDCEARPVRKRRLVQQQ